MQEFFINGDWNGKLALNSSVYLSNDQWQFLYNLNNGDGISEATPCFLNEEIEEYLSIMIQLLLLIANGKRNCRVNVLMVWFMQNLQNSLISKIYLAFTKFANKYLFFAVIFFIRFCITKIFWYSGLVKNISW